MYILSECILDRAGSEGNCPEVGVCLVGSRSTGSVAGRSQKGGKVADEAPVVTGPGS